MVIVLIASNRLAPERANALKGSFEAGVGRLTYLSYAALVFFCHNIA